MVFLNKKTVNSTKIFITFLFTQDIHLSMVSSFDGKAKRYTSVQPSIYIQRAKACPEILFFIGYISPAGKKKKPTWNPILVVGCISPGIICETNKRNTTKYLFSDQGGGEKDMKNR